MSILSSSDIELVLYDWASTSAGVPVIFRHQNAPRPAYPYVVLHFVESMHGVGQDFKGRIGSDGLMTIIGNREMSVSVESLGYDADDTLITLMNSLELQTVQDKLELAGLVYVDHTPLQDITIPFDTQMVNRIHFEVRFRITTEQKDNVGYYNALGSFDGAGITGTLTDGDHDHEVIINT